MKRFESRQALRWALVDLAGEFMRLDQRIFELLQRIPLPADVEQMWDLEIGTDVAAELYGSLRCVKRDLVEEAISTLRAAAQTTEEQLRKEFRDRESQREAATVPPSKNQKEGGNE